MNWSTLAQLADLFSAEHSGRSFRPIHTSRRSRAKLEELAPSLQRGRNEPSKRRDSNEHAAGAARPAPVVALALARRDGARHHVDPRRARSHDGRLARADAAAGRHARALGGRDRLGRIRVRRRRGARRAVLRPARRQARAQAAVPRDVVGLSRCDAAHGRDLGLLVVRVLSLSDGLRHRRRVRGDQLGDRRADSRARARPRRPRDQRQLLARRRGRRRLEHRAARAGPPRRGRRLARRVRVRRGADRRDPARAPASARKP